MRISWTSAVCLSCLLAACSSNKSGTSAKDAGDMGTSGDVGIDAPDGGFTLGFVPSNIDPASIPSPKGGLTLSGTCSVDTDQGTIDCASGPVAYAAIEQTDADKTAAALFVATNLTVDASADVSIVGSKPVIFVAFGQAKIAGNVRAVPADTAPEKGRAGGYSSPQPGDTIGLGPGGGGGGGDSMGGSGGSYCGQGGGAAPGAAYGVAEVTPLQGGSSGGSAFSSSGAGGGAIQIVARDGINVPSGGAIQVGGGGGSFGGSPMSQPGAGGGSGGAILLQGAAVSIGGTLAANGGGGGGADVTGTTGTSGQASSDPAAGGTPNGGAGGAGMTKTGTSGTDHGGAGGGVGWIRIETTAGDATITGTVSPDPATGCASVGMLSAG